MVKTNSPISINLLLLAIIIFFTNSFGVYCDELPDKLDKIFRESTGEAFLEEVQNYGISEEVLTKIINLCKDDDMLSCITINIHNAILIKQHNQALCISSYVMYTGITCIDACFKDYRIKCLECIGEHIPFLVDCISNGHIDYRIDDD